MPESAIFFFDIPIPEKIPGFPRQHVPSIFPFWGSYTFLDLALSNVSSSIEKNPILFTKKEFIKAISSIIARWKHAGLAYRFGDVTMEQFVKEIEQSREEKVILYNVGSLFLLEAVDLQRCLHDIGKTIVKVSVDTIPVDLYIADRERLTQVLSEYRRCNESGEITEKLFQEILHTSFDAMIDFSGRVLFQHSIMQLFAGNLDILKGDVRAALPSSFYTIPRCETKDTLISASGYVKSSVVFTGSKIEGYVENSIIFQGVTIKENTSIKNSVIMSSNQIGKGASIENTLLFPQLSDTVSAVTTVGERTTIGSIGSNASNNEFPKQIISGLTVIGSNPDIPEHTHIEPGCFIDADVPAAVIRRIRTMAKGTAIRHNERD